MNLLELERKKKKQIREKQWREDNKEMLKTKRDKHYAENKDEICAKARKKTRDDAFIKLMAECDQYD